MTRDEARFLLQASNGDSATDSSPEMVEALAMAEKDPELAEFLQQEREFDRAFSLEVEGIPVPPGLREKLSGLADQPAETAEVGLFARLRKIFSPETLQGIGSFAAATALVVFLAVIIFDPREATADSETPEFIKTIRAEMRANRAPQSVGDTAEDLYGYLSTKGAPLPAALPESISKLQLTGASYLEGIESRRIGTLFLENENGETFRLFILEFRPSESFIPPYPETLLREFETVSFLAWKRENKVHALVTSGPASKLEEYRASR